MLVFSHLMGLMTHVSVRVALMLSVMEQPFEKLDQNVETD